MLKMNEWRKNGDRKSIQYIFFVLFFLLRYLPFARLRSTNNDTLNIFGLFLCYLLGTLVVARRPACMRQRNDKINRDKINVER